MMAVQQPLPSPHLSAPRKRPRNFPDPSTSGRIDPDADIDGLLRIHFDRLGADLDRHNKRHCRDVLALAQRLLRHKDAELDLARRKLADLESRAVQIAAEGQIWFHVARNSEALAASLRVAVAQACPPPLPEVAESRCDGGGDEDGEIKGWKRCRVCGLGEASVLLFPCRHLCLCGECNRTVDTCPMCGLRKGTSLQALMS